MSELIAKQEYRETSSKSEEERKSLINEAKHKLLGYIYLIGLWREKNYLFKRMLAQWF